MGVVSSARFANSREVIPHEHHIEEERSFLGSSPGQCVFSHEQIARTEGGRAFDTYARESTRFLNGKGFGNGCQRPAG